MSVYVIVAANNPNGIAPLSMVGTLHAIAEALGVDSDTLATQSVPLVGEWSGLREHSRAIPLTHPRDVQGWQDVHAMAYHLRVQLGQEAVMILAEDITPRTAELMGRVFTGAERVSILLPTRIERHRENLNTSVQTEGTPIIDGVRNGSRWTTRADEYGTHVQAFV